MVALATIVLASVAVSVSTAPAPVHAATIVAPGCLGDVQGDDRVNSSDLLVVAQRFGPTTNPAYGTLYDLNNAGGINSSDLLLVAQRFGPCPPSITIQLSDLVPSGTSINGFGPFERDMSNGGDAPKDGGPLTINGEVFARGLGVHADSDLRFDVPPDCAFFSAQVGIDDEVGTEGSVSFEVWNGTTQLIYQSVELTGANAAAPITVWLFNTTTLRLVAESGVDDAFDHADWADAKLMCQAADAAAPEISDIAATPSSTSAHVSWTTDEIADSRIEYGTTDAYGSMTPLDTMLVTAHGQTIDGLAADTTYHYRVVSRDPYGNVSMSDDQTFVTSGSNGLFGQPQPFPASTNAHSVAIGDVNGDGDNDLVTANAGANTISVLLGNGDGTFDAPVPYTTGSQPKSVALGDVNGDGALDAVTANQGSSNVSVLLGNGDGTFDPKTDVAACTNAHEATLAHLNAGNALDIACVGWGASQMRVLFGNGNGTFQAATTYTVGAAPHSIAAGDFDGDTDIDLATANHNSNSISVLLNNGSGTFATHTPYAAGTQPHSLRMADLDGDGALDLVSANHASDNVSVFLGNGDGTFASQVTYATGNTPKGVAIADIDADGELDVLTANIDDNYPSLVNPGGDSISVLRGVGDGTFAPRTDYDVGQGPFAVAAGTLNGDTKPDIATANWWDGGVTVRLNAGP